MTTATMFNETTTTNDLPNPFDEQRQKQVAYDRVSILLMDLLVKIKVPGPNGKESSAYAGFLNKYPKLPYRTAVILKHRPDENKEFPWEVWIKGGIPHTVAEPNIPADGGELMTRLRHDEKNENLNGAWAGGWAFFKKSQKAGREGTLYATLRADTKPKPVTATPNDTTNEALPF